MRRKRHESGMREEPESAPSRHPACHAVEKGSRGLPSGTGVAGTVRTAAIVEFFKETTD